MKNMSVRPIVMYFLCTEQSTSLFAVRLCEPWRVSNYIKQNQIFIVDSEASLWSRCKDGCVYSCVKQVLLDQWELYQASWKINTKQLGRNETNGFLVLMCQQRIWNLTAARLSICLKCTVTLYEQSSRINLRLTKVRCSFVLYKVQQQYKNDGCAQYLHLHICKKNPIIKNVTAALEQ